MESKIASEYRMALLHSGGRASLAKYCRPVWVVGGDYGVEDRWVLKDLRYGCIDLWVGRGWRVIFRDSFFFDFRRYSEAADEGGSQIAASSLNFRVASVLGLLGCLWRNILSDISEILEGRLRQHSLQNEPYLSTNHCRIIPGNYQKFKNDILPSQGFWILLHHCGCVTVKLRGVEAVAPVHMDRKLEHYDPRDTEFTSNIGPGDNPQISNPCSYTNYIRYIIIFAVPDGGIHWPPRPLSFTPIIFGQ